MTRGKIYFMVGGAIVVALLLWVAYALQPDLGRDAAVRQAMRNQRAATEKSVGQTGDIFITGHVHRPGMLSLQPGQSLSQAIESAGGIVAANPSEMIVVLTRKVKDQSQTRTIPVPDVLSGANDPPVMVGDIIDVVHQSKPATIPDTPASPARPAR